MLFNKKDMEFLEKTAEEMLTFLASLSVNQIQSFNALDDFLTPRHGKKTNRMKLAIIILCLVKARQTEKNAIIPCLHRGICSLAINHIPFPSLKRYLKEFAEEFDMSMKDLQAITLPKKHLCKQSQSRKGFRPRSRI